MGLRKGFVLGLVAGAAAGAALNRPRAAEAPEEGELLGGESVGQEGSAGGPQEALKETLERIRSRASEAIDAAQKAAEEKEEEMRRRFEQLRRRG